MQRSKRRTLIGLALTVSLWGVVCLPIGNARADDAAQILKSMSDYLEVASCRAREE